jgi:hypothetical protein
LSCCGKGGPLVDEVVEVVEVKPVPAVVAAVVVVVVDEAVSSAHLQIAGFELHGQY